MKGGARGLSMRFLASAAEEDEGAIVGSGGQRGVVGVEVGVLPAVMAALYAAKNCGLMLLY